MFRTIEKARKYLIRAFKTNEIALLPSYLGRRTSRIRIVEVPSEIDITWILAALCKGRDEKLHILQITRSTPQNWLVQNVDILIQATPVDLKEIPDRLLIGPETILKTQVEGRKPRCFKCDIKGTVRVDCGTYTKQSEAITTEENGNDTDQKNKKRRKIGT